MSDNRAPRDEVRGNKLAELRARGGFRARILEFCCHCIYDPYAGGTYREQIENCTSTDCPLYVVRNDRNPYITEAQREAMRKNSEKGFAAMDGGPADEGENAEIREISENTGET